MKKLALTFFTFFALIGVFGVPLIAGSVSAFDAVPVCSSDAAKTDACKEVQTQAGSSDNPFIHIIEIIINAVSILVGAFAVVGIMISAVKFITAGGDSNGVASARTTLIYSVLGIAVVALAQTIVYFVLSKA